MACPNCNNDPCCHFKSVSPDPYVTDKNGSSALAKFGHLNELVDRICCLHTKGVYANNVAALAGGLVVGNIYNTVTGEVRIVV